MTSLSASRLAAATLALSVLVAPNAGKAETLKMGGTGAAIGTMRVLAEAYMDEHPGATIVVLDSLAAAAA